MTIQFDEPPSVPVGTSGNTNVHVGDETVTGGMEGWQSSDRDTNERERMGDQGQGGL